MQKEANMGKVIDIVERLRAATEPEPPQWLKNGTDALKRIPDEDGNAIIEMAVNVIMTEVRFSLGLLDIPDEIYEKDISTPFFDQINEIYQEAAGDCYFCNDAIDPNDEQFEGYLCLNCQLKMGNFLKYIGFPYEKILPLAGKRKVQKKRIKIPDVEVFVK